MVNKRTKQLKFYVSPEEFEEITTFLDQREVSQSKFFRIAVKKEIERLKNPNFDESLLNVPEILENQRIIRETLNGLEKDIHDRNKIIDGLREQIKDSETDLKEAEDKLISFYNEFMAVHQRNEMGVKTSEFLKGTNLPRKTVIQVLTSTFTNRKGGWFLDA